MVKTVWGKFALCTLGLLLLTTACSGDSSLSDGSGDKYVTATVERGDIVDAIPARGEVQATHNVEVGAEVGGRVEKILVKPGDKVEAGQLLARIEPAPYEARIAKLASTVAQAKANVTVQQADLQLSESQYDRARKLALNKTISQSKLDELKFKVERERGLLDASRASHDMAQAQLHEARIDLARTQITAPSAGTIEKVLVTEGQTINALQSTPVLFQMGNQGKDVMVMAEVAEIDIGRIHPDMKIRFTVDAWPQLMFTGTLRRIGHTPIKHGNFVSYPVEFHAANPQGKLFPGMTAHVTFVQSEARDQILLPVQALYFIPKGYEPQLDKEARQDMAQKTKDKHLSSAEAKGMRFGYEVGRLIREGKRRIFLRQNGKLHRVEVRVLAENENMVAILPGDHGVHPGATVVTGYAAAK